VQKVGKKRDAVTQGEFELINRNEATDVNSLAPNGKQLPPAQRTIPLHGPYGFAYRCFYLFHKITILFYIPYVAAFVTTKPYISMVYFEIYLDVVFFLEIISTFYMPFLNDQQRLVTDRKAIAKKYLTSFFLPEIFALFPFSVFRYNSDGWPNEKNTIVNLRYLNFKSLPRLY
jgi:hypothetical protein